MDLSTRVSIIEDILSDNIAKKDRVIGVSKMLSGIELNRLDAKTRKNLERNLIAGNHVLRQYDIVTFDDYNKMSDQHLDEMLGYLKAVYRVLRRFVIISELEISIS